MKQERDYVDALNRQKRKEMDAQIKRERDEMNAYIDYLLSDDQTDPPCLTQLVTPHVAECATSG